MIIFQVGPYIINGAPYMQPTICTAGELITQLLCSHSVLLLSPADEQLACGGVVMMCPHLAPWNSEATHNR